HLTLVGLLGALAGPLLAQEPSPTIPTLHDPAQLRARVMVLGVFHFHNPNADYAKFEGIDVLTAERQREIEAVVEQLARFRPTKIAVERPIGEADSLNADYGRYRAGEFRLTRNEVHQLAFRLAARLGHAAVYPVDFQMGMRIDTLMAYAQEHDPAFVARFNDYIGEIVELLNRMQREETIGTNLRFMNEPANVLRTHEPYAGQATVGAADGYVGARVTAEWYDRNLRIFANLASIAAPGDRALLIIGAGHTPVLRHLVETHPDMELVEAVEYLR
ncbi:MAG TPA: DUF5694 domain-containing protein, partial [Gemmatimonadales bacterium]|nr:DUF5694 domain-containing protein [Gemmatimonadales bacterium]